MWSVGCIFAEMLRRRPFLPGNDTKQQLEMIIDVLGTPNELDLGDAAPEGLNILKGLQKKSGRDFQKLFPMASNEAIDLLKRLLSFNASSRFSAEEALNHPYLASQHWPDDEVCISSQPT